MINYIKLISQNNIIGLLIKLVPVVGLGYLFLNEPEFIYSWYGKVCVIAILAVIFVNSIANDVFDIIEKYR
jgi:membrane protein DedA with SNARE-associated domain